MNERSRDATSYGDVELMDAIGQLHAAHCAIGRQMMALIAEYDRGEAYKADGAASITAWVAAFTGVSVRTADSWVRTGTALTSLPPIADAHGAGKLSFDQTRSLAGFATPDDDEELAEVARALKRMARSARTISDDEIAEARRRRSLTWRYNETSHSLRLSGWLFDADGATVVKCLERMAARAPKDPETGLYQPFESRCADALVELCGSELQVDQDAERATVVVHVDAADHAAGTGNATIEDGPVVSMDTARRLSCDGNIETITEDSRGKPVSVGRRSRKVPPHLMRALRHRDGGCRYPDAVADDGCMPIIFAIGPRGVRPISRTLLSCAASITGWSTTRDGRCAATPSEASCSCARMAGWLTPALPNYGRRLPHDCRGSSARMGVGRLVRCAGSRRNGFHDLVGDVEVGEHVLDVVEVVERV